MKMKNQKICKIMVLGVFALVLFLASSFDVKADPTWCVKDDGSDDKMDEMDIVGRYGISLVKLTDNNYQIKMEPSSNKTKRCEVTFAISSINDNASDPSVGLGFGCDNPLTIPIYGSVEDDDFGLPSVKVEFKTDSPIIKNENSSSSCYYKGAIASFSQSANIGSNVGGGTATGDPLNPVTLTVGKVDCNAAHAAGSFEERFCNAKNLAIASGSNYDFGSSTYAGTHSDYLNYKCEHKLDSGKVPLEPNTLKGDDYYVNKKYLYGTSTETVNTGNYQYHYNPGETVEGEAVSCDVTCEEAVEVEYGAPIASKAGMCFEYKARVTSRVSCYVSKAPTPPSSDYSYCTPYPKCVSSNGSVWKQGGPNEQFDACVKSCDGGKYSKKCSNKCYKEVYGTVDSKINLKFYDDYIATKLYSGSVSDCESVNPNGCYVRSGGTINWTGSGEARWYTEQNSGKWKNGNYQVFENGFYRHVKSNGAVCHDVCTWNGCEGNVYLNPGMADKDYQQNVVKYNDAVKACSAKATCNETTAEFTISADYTKYGEATVTSIKFPYDNQKDTIKHTSSVVSDTSSNSNTTLLPNDPVDGQGLLGCYKKNDAQQNLYRSTWGFPGTWLNIKTGEISFSPKTTSHTAWLERKKKFCIPNDAENVNTNWWNEFQYKVLASKGITSSITNPDVVNECCKPGSICNPITGSDPDVYNIHARTTKFGFFEWLIDIDCFYAINSTPYSSTKDKCVSNDPEDPTSTYTVRSVDLENVFPAKDGSTLTSAANTGRTPGFNWSTYATNEKNSEYTSKPSKYLEYVQGEGYAVYDESTLDYEFYLSPQTIRSMRKDGGSGKNYSNFSNSDFFIDKNGVARYKSTKIRSLPGDNHIANGQAIVCNNMENYASSKCHVD